MPKEEEKKLKDRLRHRKAYAAKQHLNWKEKPDG